jgi:hypothetical protein
MTVPARLKAAAGTRHTARPTARDIARGAEHFLTPGQPVRETLGRFIASAAETLAVVQGYLSEAFALRRYYRELEARHWRRIGRR